MRFAQVIARERNLFYPAVHPRFFVSLDGSRLRVSESNLDAALWESPSTAPGAHQQELDIRAENPEAYRRDELAFLGGTVIAGHFPHQCEPLY